MKVISQLNNSESKNCRLQIGCLYGYLKDYKLNVNISLLGRDQQRSTLLMTKVINFSQQAFSQFLHSNIWSSLIEGELIVFCPSSPSYIKSKWIFTDTFSTKSADSLKVNIWKVKLTPLRKCWLAMPLGAGILCWVLACHTIEKQKQIY